MTDFRYFADPRSSTASTWREEPQACGICGKSQPGYDGPYYGAEGIDFVCEQCLVEGRLAERGLRTNEGEPGPPADRRDELEQRTPLLVTWQDFLWPAHCDDYCQFEREVGQRELDDLADGDGATFFRDHLHADLAEHDFGWEDVPPRGPRTRDESNSPSVYLFTCTRCERPVLWWDID